MFMQVSLILTLILISSIFFRRCYLYSDVIPGKRYSQSFH